MKKSVLFLSFIFIINCQLLIVNCFAQYTKLFDFTGPNGAYPNGDLISDGTFLYGTTASGGTNDFGTIFKINPNGTGYIKLLDFSGSANGKQPLGSLISDGTFLFGETTVGGTNDKGVIFKIMPDGTGYIKLLDFNGANGGYSVGPLISDGTFLYGMTAQGGTNYTGNIFKIKPDGTGYANLLDFEPFSGLNGSKPWGGLISDGTFLYGMTRGGGIYSYGFNSYGTIFKIKHDGTAFTKLLDFSGVSNGKNPYGSLISDGTFLYGMASSGGTDSMGVFFKMKPDGTGYAKLVDFDGTNGGQPLGSLISDGIFLYGMTQQGGTNGMGVIFKIKPDGTGFSILYNFSTQNGTQPNGSLISDGTFLYGMTKYGGTNNKGTIFKYALATDIADKNTTISFALYPNPNKGTFTIETKENNYTLIISNILGEKVQEVFVNSSKKIIQLDGLTSGIYFYQIKDQIETLTKGKIIVE